MISRRLFLALTSAGILAPYGLGAVEEVPGPLDHIQLGCSDLDRGIAFVEERTSIRAAIGGVHPGRGTRNALLSLGVRRYLEIIALDPKQDKVLPFAEHQVAVLKAAATPRIVGWAVHPGSIETIITKLHDKGVATQELVNGARARPDGTTLNWKSVNLVDDQDGLLPFFIDWAPTSVHPSADAPAGLHLDRFVAEGLDPKKTAAMFEPLGIEVKTQLGEKLRLRARITGPKGSFEITS